jgi:hypothetical protein
VAWAEAFSAKDWEQLWKIENPGVKEAAKQMQAAMSNQQQRQFIWSRRLAQMDHDSQMASARAEGRTEGEDRLGQLISKLLSLGRNQDAARAAVDPAYREQLYTELGITIN